MNEDKKDKNLEKKLEEFLDTKENCNGDECVIKSPTDIVERINKKIVTEDGRQLLF